MGSKGWPKHVVLLNLYKTPCNQVSALVLMDLMGSKGWPKHVVLLNLYKTPCNQVSALALMDLMGSKVWPKHVVLLNLYKTPCNQVSALVLMDLMGSKGWPKHVVLLNSNKTPVIVTQNLCLTVVLNKLKCFMFSIFFPKIMLFMWYVEKIAYQARPQWQYGASALHAGYLRLHTHTQNM